MLVPTWRHALDADACLAPSTRVLVPRRTPALNRASNSETESVLHAMPETIYTVQPSDSHSKLYYYRWSSDVDVT